MRKRQNGKCNVRNFWQVFSWVMSFDVPAFKVCIFASDFELEYINISSRHSNSNFAHHIIIHWSLSIRCKLNVYIVTHIKRETIYDKLIFFCKISKAKKVNRMRKIWVRISTTNIYYFIYSKIQNLKSLVKSQTLNADTSGLIPKRRNCLKYLTLHLPFCPPFRKKKYSNWMALLSTLKSTALDETIKCASKWFILT